MVNALHPSRARVWIAPERTDDRRVWAWALIVALGCHLVVLSVDLPGAAVPEPPRPPAPRSPTMRLIDLPPPPMTRKAVEPLDLGSRRTPVPVAPSGPPEPMAEPPGDIAVAGPRPAPPIILGTPSAPPASGPLIPGEKGVSHPVLKTRVAPAYPELARRARVEGRAILQAVIRKDGTVAETEVLRCDRPGLGFEEAAITAIEQWRYEPARQHGVPVDVIFTIVVDFSLR